MLLSQRPMRIRRAGRPHREALVPQRQVLLFQIPIGRLQRADVPLAHPFHQAVLCRLKKSFDPSLGLPRKAPPRPAGRVINHPDQIDSLSPSFQPVVIGGVPLHQLSEATAPRPPHVHLFDPLLPPLPQPRSPHPLPYRLPAHRDLVIPRQVLARQRRTEVAVLPLDNRYRPLLDLLRDLVRRRLPTPSVDDATVSLGLNPPHQLSNPPRRTLQLLGTLSLRNMPPPNFVKHLQHISIALRQQQTFLFHPVIFPVVKRKFSLCTKRNFSLCCDMVRISRVNAK